MSKVVPRINDADRETIALGIVRKQPLKRIAALLGRHLTTISNEIFHKKVGTSKTLVPTTMRLFLNQKHAPFPESGIKENSQFSLCSPGIYTV